MEYRTIALKDGENIQPVLERKARLELATNAYISKSTRVKGRYQFEFGIVIPKFIVDNDKPPILRNISIDNVFSISARESDKILEIEWPERKEISIKLQEQKGTLIRNAENALITTMGSKLIDIPKVQNGLNPIKEILLALFELGEIPLSELRQRKGKARASQYVKFLENLEFITLDENIIYPGNQLSKYDLVKTITTAELNSTILNDVLTKGFRYLSEDLRIYILTPYLELANAYYLQSLYAEKILHMNHNEITRHYNEMYRRPTKKPAYQNLANLVEMRHAKIIQGGHGIFYGYDNLYQDFQEQLPSFNL